MTNQMGRNWQNQGRIVACDIDGTLVPLAEKGDKVYEAGYADLAKLCSAISIAKAQSNQPLYFGTATGRTLKSHERHEAAHPGFAAAASIMDFKIGAVGAEIAFCNMPDEATNLAWPPASGWQRGAVEQALEACTELELQPYPAQVIHKVSYRVTGIEDEHHDQYVGQIAARLGGIAAQIIFSGGRHLDILPAGVNKGTALDHVRRVLQVPDGDTAALDVFVAGDSMNDCALLQSADAAILPGNASPTLQRWAEQTIPHKMYIANASYAAGVLEGLQYYGALNR